MKFDRFEDIIAWQKAKELTVEVYKHFEESKFTSFNDQIQRASVSVMNNITEGFERRTNKEFSQFLFFSKGSCGEVRSMLLLAIELKKISKEEGTRLVHMSEEISKIISGINNKIIKLKTLYITTLWTLQT